jgi:hypothetical protein
MAGEGENLVRSNRLDELLEAADLQSHLCQDTLSKCLAISTLIHSLAYDLSMPSG